MHHRTLELFPLCQISAKETSTKQAGHNPRTFYKTYTYVPKLKHVCFVDSKLSHFWLQMTTQQNNLENSKTTE